MADFVDRIKLIYDVTTDQAATSLGNVKSKIGDAEGAFGKLKAAAGGVGTVIGQIGPAALAGAGAAIGAFAAGAISDFQDAAQEVAHFQEVAGGTAEDASRWVAAFDDYGVSADTAATSVSKLAKSAETSPESLTKYGVAIATAKDGSLDLNQTLLNVIDVLNQTPDAGVRAALGTAAFGKGWQDMSKVIAGGAADLKASFDSVSGSQIFSEQNLKDSEEFRQALDNVSDAVEGVQNEIGKRAIPVINDFINAMLNLKDAAGLVPEPLGKVVETAAKFNPIMLPLTAGAYGAGKALEFLGERADKDVVAIGKLNKATGEAVGSEADLKEMAKLNAEAVKESEEHTKALADAHQKAADAADKQRQALADLDDQLHANTSSLLDAQSAQIKANQDLRDYGKQLQDTTVSAEDHTLALNDMTQKLIDTATKTGEAAAAQGNFTTDTDKAAASIQAQIKYLEAVAETLAPDDPLRQNIAAYIAQLNSIKENINTEVTANTDQAMAALKALNDYILKIQGGFDLPIGFDFPIGPSQPSAGAAVVPITAAPSAMARSRAGGPVVLQTVYNVPITAGPIVGNQAELGRLVADALIAHERRIGQRRRFV